MTVPSPNCHTLHRTAKVSYSAAIIIFHHHKTTQPVRGTAGLNHQPVHTTYSDPRYNRRLHNHATPLALTTLGLGRLERGGADVVKHERQQLARDGRALHVPVCAHLRGHAVRFLRVDDAVGVVLGAQVALEAQDEEGERVAGEGGSDFGEPLGQGGWGLLEELYEWAWGLRNSTYHVLEVDEAETLAYVVAEDDHVRAEQAPVLGAGRVVELEAVPALAAAHFEYEGLVHVPEEGDGAAAVEVLPALADATVRCSGLDVRLRGEIG
jgi:hypothetical protein